MYYTRDLPSFSFIFGPVSFYFSFLFLLFSPTILYFLLVFSAPPPCLFLSPHPKKTKKQRRLNLFLIIKTISSLIIPGSLLRSRRYGKAVVYCCFTSVCCVCAGHGGGGSTCNMRQLFDFDIVAYFIFAKGVETGGNTNAVNNCEEESSQGKNR